MDAVARPPGENKLWGSRDAMSLPSSFLKLRVLLSLLMADLFASGSVSLGLEYWLRRRAAR